MPVNPFDLGAKSKQQQDIEQNEKYKGLDSKAYDQFVADLQSVGITDQLMIDKKVQVITHASDAGQGQTSLKKLLLWQFKFARISSKKTPAILVLGKPGVGKTEIIKQAAFLAGMYPLNLSLSHKIDEDMGGIPYLSTYNSSDAERRYTVIRMIKDKKVDSILKAKYDEEKKTNPTISFNNFKANNITRISKEVADPTEEEIQEALHTYKEVKMSITNAVPLWVIDIINRYNENKQQTVLFLDEINHATAGVLNSAFTLIQERRFGDNALYDLSKMIFIVAAGNFATDNPDVTPFSRPLADRFSVIIYFAPPVEESFIYVKNSIDSTKNPGVAKLITASGFSNKNLKNYFANGRNFEAFIDNLIAAEDFATQVKEAGDEEELEEMSLTDAISYFSTIDLRPNTDSLLYRPIAQFLHDLGFGVEVPSEAVPDIGSKLFALQTNLNTMWKSFARAPKAVSGLYKLKFEWPKNIAVPSNIDTTYPFVIERDTLPELFKVFFDMFAEAYIKPWSNQTKKLVTKNFLNSVLLDSGHTFEGVSSLGQALKKFTPDLYNTIPDEQN